MFGNNINITLSLTSSYKEKRGYRGWWGKHFRFALLDFLQKKDTITQCLQHMAQKRSRKKKKSEGLQHKCKFKDL